MFLRGQGWNRRVTAKVPDQKYVAKGTISIFVDFPRGYSGSAGSIPMATVERYRHYAAECVRLARQSTNPMEKDLLLQMAEQWRKLADRAEQDEKKSWRGFAS